MEKIWDQTDLKVQINRTFLLIKKFFPALGHKNYRAYFIGQVVSLIGTWLQTVAQGWLVFELTKSAFMVGFVTALGFLPVLLFSLLGGVLVDRFHKRQLLILTQALSMILGIILGLLALTGHATVLWVSILAFLTGLVNALDAPARQSFTVELVGSEHLPSAIALNMGSFNVARVIGPAIAGILIASFGTGWAFLLNGLSFLGPLIALLWMNVKSDIPKHHPHPFQSIKIGLDYVRGHQYIKSLLIFIAISSIFGWPYTTMMPIISEQVFHSDAAGLGILYSVAGAGAIVSTLIISGFYKKFKVDNLIYIGSVIFSIAIIVFSLTSKFSYALPALFFTGMGLALQNALVNSAIQHKTESALRGRVMSIFIMCLMGMQPVGSFQIGFVTEYFGPQFALAMGGFAMLMNLLFLYYSLNKKTAGSIEIAKN
jgi:MFS family permease